MRSTAPMSRAQGVWKTLGDEVSMTWAGEGPVAAGQDSPHVGLRIGDPELGKLAQVQHVLLFDSTAFLCQLRKQRLAGVAEVRPSRHADGRGANGRSRRTAIQSAISMLSLLIRLTRSFSALTAWFGCKCDCTGHHQLQSASVPVVSSEVVGGCGRGSPAWPGTRPSRGRPLRAARGW